MKFLILMFGLCLSGSLAEDREPERNRELTDFPNLPTDGPYGGHSREPNPLYYDKETRTLRMESLNRFEKYVPEDTSKKFIVDLYQINRAGTQITGQSLELYSGNRYCLMDKYVHMDAIKPFLFRSNPVEEDGYNQKILENWQFRSDDTLERIVQRIYIRHTDLCRFISVMEFSPKGHLSKELSLSIILDDDPLYVPAQQELDQYYKENDKSKPDRKNIVLSRETQEDGTILIKVHKRDSLMKETPCMEGEPFHYIFESKSKTMKLIQRSL